MLIEVFPPHGFVKCTDWHADELSIVNAARVSFHKEVEDLTDSDKGLVRFLLKNKHGTPFEQGYMAWHIRMPIFVMREHGRHRIGHSINEESGRYVKLRPDFFIPESLRVQNGKPGSYTFEQLGSTGMEEQFKQELQALNDAAWDFYERWIDMGIAKEQCRIALPLNLYTEIRWTTNPRSLMHFLELRNADPAMYEIRKYARAMEAIFSEQMPTVYEAFVDAERVAP
jgi:thymidylate synthase (FAD)